MVIMSMSSFLHATRPVPASGQLRQKPDVVLIQPADVRNAVLDHRDALDAEAERVARNLLGVVADVLEHARIDHAGARDFAPAGLLADVAALALADMTGEVDLDRRLGEREEVRTETDGDAVAHHLLREIRENALEICEAHRLGVDVKALDLVEIRAVRGVRRVAAIGAAGADHADRRLVVHHRADLDGRGLGAQEAVLAEPERVAAVHRRMVRARVERREVVEAVLELRTVRDGETELAEDRRGLLDDAGERMLDAERLPAALKRQVGIDLLRSEI